jgi:hypothetical protein
MSSNFCSCGCGLRKKPKRKFLPGHNHSNASRNRPDKAHKQHRLDKQLLALKAEENQSE